MRKSLKDIEIKHQLQVINIIVGSSMIFIILIFVNTFNRVTVAKAESYFEEISTQLEKRLDYLLQDIEVSCNKVTRSKVIKDYLVAEELLEKNIRYLYMANMLNDEIVCSNYSRETDRYIRNINVVDMEGNREQFYLDNVNDIYDLILKDYENEMQQDFNPFFTKRYYSEDREEYYFGYIAPIYQSLSQITARERIGTVIYICSIEIFQEIVEIVSHEVPSTFLLVDRNNIVFASNNRDIIGKDSTQEEVNNLYSKDKVLEYTIPIEEIGWELKYIVGVNELTRGVEEIIHVGMVIAGGTSIIIFMVCMLIIQHIKGQISHITKGCQVIGEYSSSYRIKDIGKNEIGRLVNHINQMLDKVEEMNIMVGKTKNQLLQVEIESKQATINALESQINPHFLYNTLECIKNISMAYGAEEIEVIAVLMADIFRYSIKGEEIVALERELECIKNYFGIINIRHGDRVKLEIISEGSLLQVKIPKMILQPLVENAVNHGLEKKREGGIVSIRIYSSHNDMIIEIEDNGIGMGEGQKEDLQKSLEEDIRVTHNNIGILNIHNRLRLHYGKGLIFSSKINAGTKVVMRIPK